MVVRRGEQNRVGRERERERERGKGEPHHVARGRMKHVFLSPGTHCKWMAPQSCHQRLISAARKWEKKGEQKEEKEERK